MGMPKRAARRGTNAEEKLSTRAARSVCTGIDAEAKCVILMVPRGGLPFFNNRN